jgi:hypothetical protein
VHGGGQKVDVLAAVHRRNPHFADFACLAGQRDGNPRLRARAALQLKHERRDAAFLRAIQPKGDRAGTRRLRRNRHRLTRLTGITPWATLVHISMIVVQE